MINPRNLSRLLQIFTLVCFLAPAVGMIYAQNQILGEVHFIPATKAEKSSGVWVDGQYLGYVSELKGAKKVLLVPGNHTISIRQAGFKNYEQNIVVEPGKAIDLDVRMEKDPRAEYPTNSAEVKIEIEPDRAAVFVDDAFVGYAHEFGGVGRAMLISPGKHRVKVALPGYQDFQTEINLREKQKYTIKTKLTPGSITEAGSAIKQE
jgi:uncharacterized membrane protein